MSDLIPTKRTEHRIYLLCASLIVMAVLAGAFLPGCSIPGQIKHTETFTDPAGNVTYSETIIRAPSNHVESAQFMRRIGDGFGHVQASTGAGQGVDFALQQLGTYLIPTGVGLILLGGLGLVARFGLWQIPVVGMFFSRLPKGVSASAIVLGGVFIATPLFLDRYSWLLAVGVVAAVVIGAVWAWMDNDKLLAVKPKEPE